MTTFFIVCPPVFYVLAQAGVPHGVIYFVWIGIFNLMIIAQFWSFANDVYSKQEGERLFVIVGFGASLGAVAVLPARGFALVNAALVIVWLVLAWRVGRLYKTLIASSAAPSAAA